MDVHLVDGTYELFRSYYGAPKDKSPDGREVAATRNLARSFLSLVTNEGATHVAIAFDTVIESYRNELFAGYKTGAGIEPDLWAQFPLAEQISRALGFVTWSMIEFEADDALATAAARFEADPTVNRIHLCSPDKDIMQCVRADRVVSVDRRRKKTLSEDDVVEKFGIGPRSIPDYLALVGDAADGLLGIPRWGAKSTAAVLAAYHHLEHIPAQAEAWTVKVRGAPALADNLAAARDDALLYRRLATLRTDVPLAEGLEDLEWRGANRAELTTIAAELGDDRLLARVPKWRPAP